MSETNYKISKTNLLGLLEGENILRALEDNGIENWQYFADSLESYLKRHNIFDDPTGFTILAEEQLKNFEVLS